MNSCSGRGESRAGDRIRSNFLPPVLIMHGKQDEVVPLQATQKARDALELQAVPVEYHEFNGGHQISSQMLDVARTFVLGNLT